MASLSASFASATSARSLGVRRARASAPRAASRARVVSVRAGVERFKGEGGLDAVKLTSSDGCEATAYLFGGVVTSFKNKKGREVLYVRPDAVFDKSKPISGGLPHCWPQFGPGDLQVHGFARNVDWELESVFDDDEDIPMIVMSLTPSDYTRAMWDKNFKVTQTISLMPGGILCANLNVENLGDEPFDFTASFHTYFAANIDEVVVEGLDGCKTLDRLADEPGVVSGDLKITGPVDSVYYDVPTNITLAVGDGEEVKIGGADGWKDAVVWSPWTDMACYKEFVCVENAACAEPVVVPAGGEWDASTFIRAR